MQKQHPANLNLHSQDAIAGLKSAHRCAGVPYHSVNTYITKLIDKGYKVAICEQLTDPALSQGLVERDVIRVITPGTVIETQMLNDKENNYIAAVYLKRAGKTHPAQLHTAMFQRVNSV